MKLLTLIFVIPLTLLLKFCINKSWRIDDYDRYIFGDGFPFLNHIPPLTSSNYNEIFVMESITNYLIYFIISYILVYAVNRFWLTITFQKRTRTILIILSFIFTTIYFVLNTFDWTLFGVNYYLTRPENIKVIDSKMDYIWKSNLNNSKDWRQ